MGLVLLNRFQFLAPSSLVLCRELVIVSNRCISVKEEPRSSSVNLIVAMDVAMSEVVSDLPSSRWFLHWLCQCSLSLEESCNAMHHVAAVLVSVKFYISITTDNRNNNYII